MSVRQTTGRLSSQVRIDVASGGAGTTRSGLETKVVGQQKRLELDGPGVSSRVLSWQPWSTTRFAAVFPAWSSSRCLRNVQPHRRTFLRRTADRMLGNDGSFRLIGGHDDDVRLELRRLDVRLGL